MGPLRGVFNHKLIGQCSWDLFLCPSMGWQTRLEVQDGLRRGLQPRMRADTLVLYTTLSQLRFWRAL